MLSPAGLYRRVPILFIATMGLCACTATPQAEPKKATAGAIITIDEDMYDAPALAKELCTSAAYSGAKLLESKDGSSSFQCYN